MARERTLAIVKPDAMRKNALGPALAAAAEAGLSVVAVETLWLSKRQAEGFYAVHRERPFFDSLTDFMSSGPIAVMVLEGEDAIAVWRRILGATDPAKAAPGTLRARFGTDIQANGFHGSDGPETAAFEIAYMFPGRAL
ncbi:MAG: nucleoside-diphosphate kinase [Acidobacteria bacterium]|nr:MAG: nucleoside-diphosphate kinase [Acidobacteriota bacterium]